MQGVVKFIMKTLYGFQIRKDINEFHKCTSQHWMETEYDDIVLDSWRLPFGNYNVKPKKKTD